MNILYSIIFALLMFGDWSQNAMNGGIWTITVNCIGLLMCALMFSLFSWKECRRRYYRTWLIVWFIGAIIAYAWWKTDSWHVLDGQFITAELNIGAIGILVIRYMEDGIFLDFFKKKENRNIGLVGLWGVLTLWMCISPQRSLWHLYYFAVFMLFYLAPVDEIQKKKIANGALNGVIIGFFLLQTFAYGIRPYDEVRYAGFYTNCNLNALMYLVTYIVMLTRILYWDSQEKSVEKKWKLVFYYVLAGGLLGFQIMTMTRTALIMDVVVTIAFLWVWIIRKGKEKKAFSKIVSGALTRCALIMSLMVILFPLVFGTVRYLPTIMHHPVWFLGEYSIEKVHSFDSWDSAKYIEWDEFWEAFNDRFMRIKSGGTADVEDTLNDLSSGRIDIWRMYLQKMNIIGHITKKELLQINDHYSAWHAHNIFIQMGYVYGIPAMIMLFIFAVVLGIRLLNRFLKNPYDQWNIFRGFVYLVFFGYGMLEMTWNTGQMILVLIFFTQKSLESKEVKIEGGERLA